MPVQVLGIVHRTAIRIIPYISGIAEFAVLYRIRMIAPCTVLLRYEL